MLYIIDFWESDNHIKIYEGRNFNGALATLRAYIQLLDRESFVPIYNGNAHFDIGFYTCTTEQAKAGNYGVPISFGWWYDNRQSAFDSAVNRSIKRKARAFGLAYKVEEL